MDDGCDDDDSGGGCDLTFENVIFWTGSDIFRLVLSRLFSLRFASFVLATNLRSWYVACGKGVEQKDQHTIVCLSRRLPLNLLDVQ